MRQYLPIVALLLCTAPAGATDVQTINADCQKSPIWCDAFMTGMVIGISEFQTMVEAKAERAFCPPQNTRYSTGVAVVQKFIENNPRLWTREITLVALLALADAWPCR